MPTNEWKSSIDSLTKDIAELRKELLTERVKNLPDMVQNMVRTARQDMEVRVNDIQDSVKEERALVDDRVAQVDSKLKELDELIDRIETRDKKVEDFVDTYSGSLTEIKTQIKVLNDDFRKFQGEMKSKFDSVKADINKITTFSDQIDSSIRRSFEVKRDWGKVSTRFDRIEEKHKEFEKLSKAVSKNEGDLARVSQSLDNFVKEVTKTKDDLADVNKNFVENLERVSELTKTYSEIVGFKEEMVGKMNFFKDTSSRLDSLEDMGKKFKNWIAEDRKKLDNVREASEQIVELRDRLASRIDAIEGFRKELNDVSSKTNEMLGKVQASESVIGQFREYVTKLSEMAKYFGEVSGKVTELERYFKDPKAWLGDNIEEFVKDSVAKMERTVAGASSSLENNRNYIRQEFIQIMIISKLTEVANAETMGDMVSNMRALEFLVSEAVRMGTWNSELEKGIVETLSNTRDFWEARKPELSDVIQKGVESIEAQIRKR